MELTDTVHQLDLVFATITGPKNFVTNVLQINMGPIVTYFVKLLKPVRMEEEPAIQQLACAIVPRRLPEPIANRVLRIDITAIVKSIVITLILVSTVTVILRERVIV